MQKNNPILVVIKKQIIIYLGNNIKHNISFYYKIAQKLFIWLNLLRVEKEKIIDYLILYLKIFFNIFSKTSYIKPCFLNILNIN